MRGSMRQITATRAGGTVLDFHVFAALYLAVALVVAWRAPGRPARVGLRAQLAVTCAVLGAGLLWPERWRTGLDRFSG